MNHFKVVMPLSQVFLRAAGIGKNFVGNETNRLLKISNSPSLPFVRYVSVTKKMCANEIVPYDEFKNLINDKSTLIIDVREPQELQETGVIPGSINIPCKSKY